MNNLKTQLIDLPPINTDCMSGSSSHTKIVVVKMSPNYEYQIIMLMGHAHEYSLSISLQHSCLCSLCAYFLDVEEGMREGGAETLETGSSTAVTLT